MILFMTQNSLPDILDPQMMIAEQANHIQVYYTPQELRDICVKMGLACYSHSTDIDTAPPMELCKSIFAHIGFTI